MKFRNVFCGLLLGLLVLTIASPSANAAAVTVPPGLNPGDTYRLVFVTAGTISASSGLNSTYNNFVTNQANLGGLGVLGATWKAVVSTTNQCPGGQTCNDTHAKDNTSTNPGSTGVPIYNLAGN